MQAADAMIHQIANQERFVANQKNAVRLIELSLRPRPFVAGKPGLASSSDRRDHARLHVYLADDVIVALREIEIATAIEKQLMRRAERSIHGRAAIAAISF